MPRDLIRRYTPHPDRIREHKALRFMSHLLYEPNLWHLNRRSVSRAMAVGLFWALIPMPMQTAPAVAMAIFLRTNLPVCLGLVWLTNPLTTPPVMYATYRLGAWLLGEPALSLPDSLSLEWVTNEIANVWKPLYLGSLVAAVGCSVIGYGGTRLYWRWWIQRQWQKRKNSRRQRLG